MPEVKKTSQRRNKISADVDADDRFLQDHFRDVRAEMTWRRELEFRLMQFMLIFYPIIGAAMIELFGRSIDPFIFLAISAGAIFFIMYATNMVTNRIDREHEAYAELAKQVQMIWMYYRMFETGAYLKDQALLPERLRPERGEYGKGEGYKRTNQLIWVTTGAIVAVLITLAVAKFFVK